jgi:hypothetical protein
MRSDPHVNLRAKCLLFLSNFDKLESVSTKFSELPHIQNILQLHAIFYTTVCWYQSHTSKWVSTLMISLESHSSYNCNFHGSTSNISSVSCAQYKRETNKHFVFFFFLTRDARNGLHVHGYTTQFCVKKNLAGVRKFWVHSLFRVKSVECDVTVRLFYRF